MSRQWLLYRVPNYLIQQRSGTIRLYEIWMPEFDIDVGMVEMYEDSGKIRWRTLDHRKNDWRKGFASRESASQDLVACCPRTIQRVAFARERSGRRQMTLREEGSSGTMVQPTGSSGSSGRQGDQ